MRLFLHLILVLVYLFNAISSTRGALYKREISNVDAKCCDGSKAIYYIEEVTQAESWIIFLEGGGGCSSAEECDSQYKRDNLKVLFGSGMYPPKVQGQDLLSNNADINPLYYNFNRVLIPYCSQDAFLANSPTPLGNNSFVFRGRVILQSAIKDLLPLGLANSTRVVFAGSSAGGVGIMNNLEWIQSTLTSNGSSPELALIIDSSWFIPYGGYHAINFSQDFPAMLNITSPACMDHSLGFPCCTSLACLLTNNRYFPAPLPPTFVITSLYDIFTLEESLKGIAAQLDFSPESEISDQDFLRIFNTYGTLMNGSLIDTYKHANNKKLSVFAPSCTQHVYLATSDLWGSNGVLNGTVDAVFQENVFTLTNPLQAGQWDRTMVNVSDSEQISLHKALQKWYPNNTQQVIHMDICTGPACGGSMCPSSIQLEFSYDLWPDEAVIVVLVIAGLMAGTPLLIKIGLYICMKYMLYKQRVYVYKMTRTTKNKPKFPKAVHAVSVSCSGLYYRLDVADNTKKADPDQTEPERLPTRHYRLLAFSSTLMPCCKPLCYRYNAPVGDSETGQADNVTMPNPVCFNSNTLRSDSGISSSIGSNHVKMNSLDYTDSSSVDLIIDSRTLSTPVHKPPPAVKKSSLKKKTILRQVNMYVNPGELLAIMGPSGSGKTTLLDVLLGRRRVGQVQGDIWVNGVLLSKMREWFIMNTGYVRQLATSFYNELSVRENLLFSMNMQAPAGMTLAQKLERVEQVIRETGLQDQADLVVGCGIGLGLSGGQRKRLTIAVQLLSMPSIIFLDEPTSGLDSASSLDILKSLQVMAGTGRGIVVTIHQPRSEIFHAFDKILLLCNGQVAFFGSPVKVWDFFQKAILNEQLEKHEGQVQDQILDHLKGTKSQEQVLSAYTKSLEPRKVKSAVLEGREDTDSIPSPVYKHHPGFWQRLVSLEARASLRQTLFTILYLPIVYTVFGVLLGTTYLNPDTPVQVMSVTCLLTCSSSLFMSSIVMSLLIEPLKLFHLEHSDRFSSSHELILQVYLRMSFVSTLPLSLCATLVYLLVYFQEDFRVYVIVLLTFLLINQVWISIFILLTNLAPSQAHRLCPVSAAVGGFWCGFIIPKPLMPPYYMWIFYINPSFYAYSATSVTILSRLELPCDRDSDLECFRTSGYAALSQFGIADVNPFLNIVILMIMTVLVLVLAVVVLELKVSASLIREHIRNAFYNCCKKRKNSETKISSSTDNLNEVDTPVQLRSFRKNRLQAQSKESIQRAAEERQSFAFIDQNKHKVFHNFPWERTPTEEVDGLEVDTQLFSPSTSSRRSRIASDGSEDVFEPPQFISMASSEEVDEEERRKLAEEKWEARRLKIENEIRRLRTANMQRRAAQRHSIASFGDDLEDQIFHERKDSMPRKRYLSTAIQHAVDVSKGLEMEFPAPVSRLKKDKPLKEKPPFLRAASLPTTDGIMDKVAAMPTLDTYEEEEGEMMGLPPKDIPHLRESMEQMDRIDYEEIPPQQLSDIPSSQESSGSRWSQV